MARVVKRARSEVEVELRRFEPQTGVLVMPWTRYPSLSAATRECEQYHGLNVAALQRLVRGVKQHYNGFEARRYCSRRQRDEEEEDDDDGVKVCTRPPYFAALVTKPVIVPSGPPKPPIWFMQQHSGGGGGATPPSLGVAEAAPSGGDGDDPAGAPPPPMSAAAAVGRWSGSPVVEKLRAADVRVGLSVVRVIPGRGAYRCTVEHTSAYRDGTMSAAASS